MTYALECCEVGRIFTDGQHQREVLRDFSAQWALGQLVGIGGHSGAGKSTLLSILAGIDSGYVGSVKIDNQEMRNLNEGQRAKLRQRQLSFAFQSPHLFPHLSLNENLQVAADVTDSHQRFRDHRDQLAERLGLGGSLHHTPDTLSGGERRRATLLRTLLSPASILLFDEPGAHLDAPLKERVFKLLREHAQEGKLVIFSSHAPEHLAQADTLHHLKAEHR